MKKKSSSTSSTRKTKKVHHARINIFFFIIFKRGYSRFVPKLHSFKVGSTDLRFFLLRVGSLETHSVRCILSFYDGFVRSRVASCSLFTESARFSKFRARVEDVNFSAIPRFAFRVTPSFLFKASFEGCSLIFVFFLLRNGSLETHSVRCILSFYVGNVGCVRSRVASRFPFYGKIVKREG